MWGERDGLCHVSKGDGLDFQRLHGPSFQVCLRKGPDDREPPDTAHLRGSHSTATGAGKEKEDGPQLFWLTCSGEVADHPIEIFLDFPGVDPTQGSSN